MNKPTYRASSIYSCKRHLSAIRLGIEGDPEPEFLRIAAEEGTIHEGIIKNKLRAEGIEVIDGRDINGVDDEGKELPCPICLERFGDERFGIHTEINTDLFDIVGHKDGEALEAIFRRLLETKTMSEREYWRWKKEGWGGFAPYARQATIYAKDYDETLYVIKNRSSGYTDKYYLDEPPLVLNDIIAHITEVENWVLKHGVPAEGDFDPHSTECKRCPFRRVLECVKKIDIKKDAVPQLDDAAADWLRGKDLSDESNRLKKEADELMNNSKDIFEAYSIKEGLKEKPWDHGGCTIVHRRTTRKGYVVEDFVGDTTKITRSKVRAEDD